MKKHPIYPLILMLLLLPGTVSFSQAVIQGRDRQNDRTGTEAPDTNAKYKVTIDANIKGADIYVDERFMGETPLTVNLAVGSHRVLVRLPKFEEYRRDINVRGPMTLNAELVRRLARVDIRVSEDVLGSGPWYQSNALAITIDGERIRKESVDLSEGTHTIQFSYGNLKFEKTFTVTSGRNYTLEPVFSINLVPQGTQNGDQTEQGLQLGSNPKK